MLAIFNYLTWPFLGIVLLLIIFSLVAVVLNLARTGVLALRHKTLQVRRLFINCYCDNSKSFQLLIVVYSIKAGNVY